MVGEAPGPHDRLLALNRARHDVYSFLAQAFLTPPTPQLLSALAAEDLLDGAADLLGEDGLRALRHYQESARQGADWPEQARREFMDLFKVPGGRYLAPYESVFRDTRDVAGRQVSGLLMGPSAAHVLKWYRLAAVEISGDYKDLPDHIGLELSFLAHLCAKEQGFADRGDQPRLTRAREMERDFLAAHIVSWAKPLRDKLHDQSRHAFFQTVADLLVAFTQRDLGMLEGLLGPSAGKPIPDYGPMSR